jgi:hypothetical protein
VPRARDGTRRHAGDPAGNGRPGDPDANDEALRVFEFGGLGLSGGFGVEKESSAPHTRLAYTHLQTSFARNVAGLKRITAGFRRVNEIGARRP